MTDLQIFNYNSNEVRTLEVDGNSWFVLKDVCMVLGISHITDTAKRMDEDEVGQTEVIDSMGRKQSTYIISESGLYNVILRSDKPEAKPFRKWVTSEVLPSIRKNGHYMTPAALREAILNPDTVIQLCQQIKAEREKNAKLTAENAKLTAANEAMQPKADYFDRQVAANQLTGLYETADGLRIPRRTFVAWLTEKGYLYRNHCNKLVPDPAMNDGLFQPKEYTSSGAPLNGTQTMVTPKGRETFRLLLIGSK